MGRLVKTVRVRVERWGAFCGDNRRFVKDHNVYQERYHGCPSDQSQ